MAKNKIIYTEEIPEKKYEYKCATKPNVAHWKARRYVTDCTNEEIKKHLSKSLDGRDYVLMKREVV